MGYWIDQIVGEGVMSVIDQIAAGFLIVGFCVTGTGGMCR